MEVGNYVDLHSREELKQWYLDNHDKETELWIRVNRAQQAIPGIIGYIDAVEVALCFGWIDSVQKRIDSGKPIQRFTPRRKRTIWCEMNIERCRRLIKLGEMTPAGKTVLPDMNPAHFVIYDWVLEAFRQDPVTWEKFQQTPDAFKRIKIFRIQHYADTHRMDEAQRTLKKLVSNVQNGKFERAWDDYGRLSDY